MDAIRLADHGVRLFAGRLYNHDYLWFSSTEISKVSTTLPVIHNYALTYALSSFSYAAFLGNTPRYAEDLSKMPLYATPAMAEGVSRTTITYNAVDSLSLRTDVGPSVNTPNLGWRVYLDPIYESRDGAQPAKGYTFYAFVFAKEYQAIFGDVRPQVVFRLGKKGTPVRARWQEVHNPVALYREIPTRPGHLVNPLDVGGQVKSLDVISVPPHLLFRTVEITGDWFIFGSGAPIHLPKTVRQRMGL
jgi:CRISPR-associated protein Csc1